MRSLVLLLGVLSAARAVEVAVSRAPASTDQLADVVVKAVTLMDGGIQKFLTEQEREDQAYSDNAQSSIDEVTFMSESNKKAIAVIKQMSSNFHGLESVVKKLKESHQSKAASSGSQAVQKQVAELMRENRALLADKDQMQATVQTLVQHSQECQDQLQQQQESGGQSEQADQDQVGQKSGQSFERADQTKMKILQKENEALKEKLNRTIDAGREIEGEMVEDQTKASGLLNEIGELKRKNADLTSDKAGLVKSVQQMLANSHAFSLETTIKNANAAKLEMQKDYEKKLAELKKREEAIQDKNEDSKEVLEQLQAQNVDLEKSNDGLKKELAVQKTKNEQLSADKGHLMESLQSMLRQNTVYQNKLAEMQHKLQEAARTKPKPAPPPAQEAQAPKEEEDEAASSDEDPIQGMADTEQMTHYIDKTVSDIEKDGGDPAPESPPPAAPQPAPPKRKLRAHHRHQHRAEVINKKAVEAANRAIRSKKMDPALAGYLDGGIPRKGPAEEVQQQEQEPAEPQPGAATAEQEGAAPPAAASSTSENDQYGDAASKLLEQAEKEISDASKQDS